MFNLVEPGFKVQRGLRVHEEDRSSDGVLQVLAEPQVVHERLRTKQETGSACQNNITSNLPMAF